MDKLIPWIALCVLILGLACGFGIGRSYTNNQYDVVIKGIDKNLKETAKSRGWKIEDRVINSVSIQYLVKIDDGKIHRINILTVRDPFGEYRTMIFSCTHGPTGKKIVLC